MSDTAVVVLGVGMAISVAPLTAVAEAFVEGYRVVIWIAAALAVASSLSATALTGRKIEIEGLEDESNIAG